ncbi:MAG: ABC transporter transmembrane domain-containing protein [Pseudomonadota bacterium]
MSIDDGLDRASSKDLRGLKPALKFILPYKRQVAYASLALVVTAAATLSLGQGVRVVIDQGFASGEQNFLSQSLFLFAGFVLVLTIGTFIRFYFVSWVGERVSADIRKAVFGHLIRLHPGFFEENIPSEIQSRITTDTTLLQTVIGSSVSIALRNILMFAGGVILLFVTNAKLSMIVLASVPLVVLPIVLFGRRVRTLSRTSQDRLADVGSYAGESLRHIKVVQSFNHEKVDMDAFDQRVDLAFEVSLQRIRFRAILIAVVMLVVFGAVATMLWVGGQDVLGGQISAGELAAFIFYAFIVAGSVGAISEVVSDLQRAAGATERLIELLLSPSDILAPTEPAKVAAGNHHVSVEDLVFAYPNRANQRVLHNVSFAVAPGEMVALVGPSGAGKSTLFDLLQRFYDPQVGRITLGGEDIRRLTLEDLRARVGFVPQDPTLFSGTLESNLRYANANADATKLREVLELAHAWDFVQKLPDGLNTSVGEDGVGLSGGQKQRLAIARALLSQPDILLLDEATSALDAESEHLIRESIDALKGRMTILVIAHRLSTVRQADRILVLEEGQLVGVGTHEELLSDSELYARFAKMQFAA